MVGVCVRTCFDGLMGLLCFGGGPGAARWNAQFSSIISAISARFGLKIGDSDSWRPRQQHDTAP